MMKRAPLITPPRPAPTVSPHSASSTAPALADLQQRMASMTGNTVTLPVKGRNIVFRLKEIQADKVERATMVWAGNERIQNLLNERSLADLLPSIKSNGQNTPAIGRETSGIIEVADGSRRRMSSIIAKRNFLVLIGDLTDDEMNYLSETGNFYRPVSAYERGIRYKRRLKNEFDDNVTALAAAESIDRKIIDRCIATASLPIEVIQVFDNPGDISARFGEQLAKMAKDDAVREMMIAQTETIRTGRLMGNVFDKDRLIQLFTSVIKMNFNDEIKPAKETKKYGKLAVVSAAGKHVNIKLTNADPELLKKVEALLEQYSQREADSIRDNVNESFDELERIAAAIHSDSAGN